MLERQIANAIKRLINERPVKMWYINKTQHPKGVDWVAVVKVLNDDGYKVEDQGIIVKAWI